jgi:hypothetical protein
LHFGQRILLPAEFSGALSFVPHPLHCTIVGIDRSTAGFYAERKSVQDGEEPGRRAA